MSATSPSSSQNYLVRTADLPSDALEHRIHPIVHTNHRYQLSLGDITGLTKTAVHLGRLPPGATSTTLHWHTHEDEWFYVLEAGPDAVLLVWEGDSEVKDREVVVPREERVQKGDFFGFKAGVPCAHAFRAGATEMVYLIGGSREPLDISRYPAEGKSRIVSREAEWTVEDRSVIMEEKQPYQK
ncbi:hypothetical protein L226DRAFT_554071 [Lentinus tigrinus ALCF2SS1-7]|uniref:Uncharacterized protein n=1 Tax=Lentinus tigrinus ALCF2SS1-6 TaxID=1328759 RepID=A0A5C2RSL3_9APHY|nr:hypothetical protein L227DRAFT_557607 [Lentinus tigrinus ALCF2SS1-6]RPD72651.1 hypothetical protein L226DRAFT_554071 [Lentinus tigrinus ALCF2SS1-7]